MSAFAQGLQAGQRMAEGWIGAYDASRRRREEEELKRRREEIMSAQPEDLGFEYSPEQIERLETAASSGEYGIDVGAGGIGGGYRLTRQGEDGPQTEVLTPALQRSRFLGQEVEGRFTPQQIQQMRERALIETIADPLERQRGLQAMRQGELADLQLSEARAAIDMRERTRTATQQVAQRLAAGEIIDVPTLFQIAAESGADVNELMQTAGRAYEITTKQADTVTRKLVGDIRNANTPQKFNELLKQFDPNPEDDIVPELRIAPDGTHQVFYGDQPFSPPFRGNRDMSAMAQLASHYTDQVSGNPMATAIQLATLEKVRAQTQQAKAGAARAGRSSMQEWTENFRELMGRDPTQEEIRVRMGVEARPSATRIPSAADINSRARLYLDNDRTGNLTVQEATAMAERDFGLREGPTNERAALVDAAIGDAQPRGLTPGARPTAAPTTATPAGQQLLGLYNVLVPEDQRPAAFTPPAPRTQQERLRQLYR